MTGVRVTIVIPVYNGSRYLAAAIRSVLSQKYENIELIVVDDGSTDESGVIAKSFASRLNLIQQSNAGQSAALAVGWSAASGDIFGYLSADDLLKERAVGDCVVALQRNPDVALVYPDFGLIDASSKPIGTVIVPEFSRRALFGELRCLPGPGALFRKEAYLKAGVWRSDLRQIPDLDFFLRMGLSGNFLRVPIVSADFRKHAESTTYQVTTFARAEEPLKMLEGFYARNDLPDDVRAWRSNANASAYHLSAIYHAQSGRPLVALRRIIQATVTQPASFFSRKSLASCSALLGSVRSFWLKQEQ